MPIGPKVSGRKKRSGMAKGSLPRIYRPDPIDAHLEVVQRLRNLPKPTTSGEEGEKEEEQTFEGLCKVCGGKEFKLFGHPVRVPSLNDRLISSGNGSPQLRFQHQGYSCTSCHLVYAELPQQAEGEQ